ncbi:glycosyltransferase family 2 protein [bacterium]|nr:glycosyltransferase family 2 protein [bacterium]
MNKPKISVIIVYNNKSNLENCLKSVLAQTFSNIEVICVNNASKDNAQDIVKQYANKNECIKLIELPYENDAMFAKRAGLGVAEGDFIYFISPEKELNSNFLMNEYINTSVKENIKIENNHLYRRNFLENDEEITGFIKEKIELEAKKYAQLLKEEKESIKKEFDKFYQINAENIKNSAYDITCRFTQLEKNFYEKDYQYNEKIQNSLKEYNEQNKENTGKIYADISKVYDFVVSEVNKKGTDINKVYDEITKNYHYTENLIEEKKKELLDISNNRNDNLAEKVTEIEKELTLRYVNLKRLMDIQLDDMLLKINSISPKGTEDNNSLNKTLSDNIDNMYVQINKLSSSFYEELTKMYKETNEKFIQAKAEYNNNLDKKISELRNEFNSETGKE